MLEYLRQKLEFAYVFGIKRLWEINKSNEPHPTYLVAISIINAQCEKNVKSQKFLKK